VEYVDETHPSVVGLAAWLDSLAPFARAHEEGEIDELLEAAAQGELEESGDERTPIKPIRVNPELFELRRKALVMNLRFYHGEPQALPTSLVALHRHIKGRGGPTQQQEINQAALRYAAGRPTNWS